MPSEYTFADVLKGFRAVAPYKAPVNLLADKLEDFERRLITEAVNDTKTIAEAARKLGVDRTTLSKKISRLGLRKETEA